MNLWALPIIAAGARVRTFDVDLGMITAMAAGTAFKPGTEYTTNWPADGTIVAVVPTTHGSIVRFLVHSETFDPVVRGADPQPLDVTFTAHEGRWKPVEVA